MKRLLIIGLTGLLVSCGLLGESIIINTPQVPAINLCKNVATDADIDNMINQIKSQSFANERMDRARWVTKDYCFISEQVVRIMGAFNFADDQLEIAKHLYKPTTDKNNYYLCIDTLAHKSDRDKLKAYIAAN